MAYIGRGLQSGAFRQLDDISSGFDGSDTTHTMQVNSTNVTVGDVNQILLSLGGVIQKPGTDFTVSSSTLTFTTAPAANTSFFAILLGSDNGGTVTPTDGSVTDSKIPSSGGFTIGATGTASTLAGIPFFSDTSNKSMYTHDVSGTDSTAAGNTAFGFTAMDAITTGDDNVAIGENAATALTTGSNNVAIGKNAFAAATTAGRNICIGDGAGQAMGVDGGTAAHVFIGHNAGNDCTSNAYSIFIGGFAGDGHDTENHNLGIGYDALGGSVAGGEYNVAIGNYALDALAAGDGNVVIGYGTGSTLTNGNYNVAIGHETMHNGVTSGEHNICSGYRSGYSLTSGGNNVFSGLQAGLSSTTGSNNVGIGPYAGYAIAGDGNYNTLVGYAAGFAITTGDNLLCLGKDSGRTGSPGGNITTQNNYIMLGDENITEAYIQVSFQASSDERDKTDFTALDIGLDFVNALKPYTYKWDKRSKYGDKLADDYDLNAQTPDGTHKEDWLDIGFKAQEVEVLEKAAGYKIADKTNLITTLSDDGKQYGLKYERLVPVLVKAVQELSAKVKALEDA
jgi:hypothetical protein